MVSGVNECLNQVTVLKTLFRQADEALADGNLGEYQTKVDEGRRQLDEAIVILEAELQN